ncbi:hypothetical protein GXW74_17595 [Roseomonas eburnea]|uniref:Uncharacterized protein n=1 Tax=Neoroseomonas eburnea TaxID=1346889 RepID=A0A9X9XF24_9PROT|nr:hypothetical protein [Neoroseomonas eburnea]MBR0682310.1 hypothetical protein [Neoroseomonas eburnea]
MVNSSGFGRRAVSLALCGLAAGCTGLPQPPVTRLPVDPTLGFADPTRQAIIHASYVFPQPASLRGNPVEAAQAISEAEHLAVELRYGPRWVEMSPLVPMAFAQAREEWRGALGIAPEAAPQAVIDAMTAVRLALAAQNPPGAAAALRPPVVAPGGAASLQRLAELPPLPRTAWASQMAMQEMWRIQRQDSRNRPWL